MEALARIAARLGREAGAPAGLPTLYALTDPERTPDPLALAERLPPGAALIYRTFGAPAAERMAQARRRVCTAGGVMLLIGADVALAERIGADGVHVPERLWRNLPRLCRRGPGWLLTAAAHSAAAARRAAALGADAVLVSTAFTSASPSAAPPLGPQRLAAIARSATAPVIALGGIDEITACRLLNTGVAGVAAVDAFRTGTRSPAAPAAAVRAG